MPGPKSRCELPAWLIDHHSWTSLDSSIQLHINSGEKSFKLKNLQDIIHPEDSHVSCHNIVKKKRNIVKLVTYAKSGCDSGFVCSVFIQEAPNVIKVLFGHKARSPAEACSDLYFSSSVIKSLLLVSKATSINSCPMSGRYNISPHSPLPITHCPKPASLHLISGCGSSALTVEYQCSSQNRTKTEYSCKAHWTGPGQRTNIILSSHTSSQLMCLSYTENQGYLSSHSCHTELHHNTFNISQSGPCVQALSSVSFAVSLTYSLVTLLIFVSSSLFCTVRSY